MNEEKILRAVSFGEQNEKTDNFAEQNKEKNSKVKNEKKMCKKKDRPTILEIFNKHVDDLHCKDVEPFVIGYQGKSDLVGKWGQCLEIVDQILSECDTSHKRSKTLSEKISSTSDTADKLGKVKRLPSIYYEEHESLHVFSSDRKTCLFTLDKTCKKESDEDGVKCDMNKTENSIRKGRNCGDEICALDDEDDFDNLRRFENIGTRGVASLCRTLTRW